ncbi:MAG: DUF1156 domain-containing protein [Burkholderiaceae bacterium]
MTASRKKLIEVALPLDAINAASAREKSIRHGHPSTLHLWWARRPLAAARAVIFAQMVDDPSTYVDTLLRDPALKRRAQRELKDRQLLWKTRSEAYAAAQAAGDTTVHAPGEPPTLEGCAADLERERLFDIIRELVKWENTTNESVLQAARDEIWQSWRRACADNADHPRAAELFRRDQLPAFHDPFAGGGALPLEAQRLGLEAHASDLNPVAVLINKAMIEIPPRFAGRPPVNPESRKKMAHGGSWRGAQGLAEDVRYYGQWMRDEAEKRIGHLYPKVEVTAEMVKSARPQALPGPTADRDRVAVGAHGEESEPGVLGCGGATGIDLHAVDQGGQGGVCRACDRGWRLSLHGEGGQAEECRGCKNGTKLSRGANFRCLMSGTPIALSDQSTARPKPGAWVHG